MHFVVFCALLLFINVRVSTEDINKVACLTTEFRCRDNSTCIPSIWQCDLTPDCPDASDELPDCPSVVCANSFRCNVTERCIPRGWLCDGEFDCGPGDQSDELFNCSSTKLPCPPNQFACVDSGHCLDMSVRCNGIDDCLDGSDEGDYCQNSTICDHAGCFHDCRPSSDGKNVCFCPEGKMPKQRECIDFDQCEMVGPCDQICINEDQSKFSCQCVDGYELQEIVHCSAINVPRDEPMRLITASETSIEQLDTNGTVLSGNLSRSIDHLSAIGFNHRNGTVCWVNSSSFMCAQVDNLNNSWILEPPKYYGFNFVHQITLDWVTGNWYILDAREAIFMCNGTLEICITLIDVTVNKPRGLALDPSAGFMFFTAWGSNDPHPKVERALMDGSERKVIVMTKIAYPMGVTIDYANKHVYWTDGYHNNVQRVNYDGSDREIVAARNSLSFKYPFGVTILANYLFIITDGFHSVTKINLFQYKRPQKMALFKTSEKFFVDVIAYHRQRQPQVDHPCGQNNGGCDHFCFPLWDEKEPMPRCRCQPGFELALNGSCAGKEISSFLIYTKGTPGMIKGISLDIPRSPEVIMPITSIKKSIALDFDAKNGFIYYADNEEFVIERQNIDGSARELVVTGLNNVEGLAVDWMGRNLYWTDEGVSTIFVCSLDEPTKVRILENKNLRNVRAIALHPQSGIMFWSIWELYTENMYGLIETSWMDGTHRSVFVNAGLYWPNGLTIDYVNEKLYWCDGFLLKIERINTDGTNRELILEGPHLGHPYGLTYFNNHIYWTEYQNGSIVRMNLSGPPTDIVILQEENPKLFDIKVFSKDRQVGTNGCESFPCEDMCFATPEGPKCGCRMSYEPDSKNPAACIESVNYVSEICKEDQFLCNKSLFCIQKSFVCDGEFDCRDKSDEDSSPGGVCELGTCNNRMFKCENNKCIRSTFVCDGDNDCMDMSDELEENCRCQASEFTCESGKCIPQIWVCDRENDCGPDDKSDEHSQCDYKTCEFNYFTCGDKKCIPILWVCDNERDCVDGEDELFCAEFCKLSLQSDQQVSPFCTPNCNSSSVCDSDNCVVCQDDNSTCISHVQLCDKVEDCPSGSDEKNCFMVNFPWCLNQFKCSDTQCIAKKLKCDGKEDCLDGSDEAGCVDIKCAEQMWQCTTGRQCVYKSLRCDKNIDCKDESDELNCEPETLVCLKPSILCDNDTKCIPPHGICDQFPQCIDGSDEGRRCLDDDCDLINCEDICMQSPKGPYCLCSDGQKLLDDGLSCPKINPCDQWGICSQTCVPMIWNFYKCACQAGFNLEYDGYTCKSTDHASPYVLFSNRHELRRLTLSPSGIADKVVISSLKLTIALDFYLSGDEEYVYWTDVTEDKIYRGSMILGSLTNVEVVVQTGLETAEGLAVDWVGKNLYWVESNLDQIEVSKLDGSFRRTLISSDMESPRAISLDPRVGILFWTDWQKQNARIESASMSGEDRKIIVRVTDIKGGGWPNGLTLDYVLKRLYWIDAKSDSIHSAFYDGSDNREILRSHERLSHAFAISLFGLNVYWTDWRTNAVMSANKFDGSNIKILTRTIGEPFDIRIVHPSRQPKAAVNPCEVNNGGCSHLCLLSTNSTRRCNCPQIMSLSPDNVNCIRKEKVLVLSRANEIRGLDFEKASSDIMMKIALKSSQTNVPFDFTSEYGMIYWIDVAMSRIQRMNMSDSSSVIETILDTGIESPRSFAIDWLSKNMFIGSSGQVRKQISVATTEGLFYMPIVTEDIYEIESMAVDPYDAKIFWSDIGSDLHTIHMATMLGTDRQTVSSQNDNKLLDFPTSLVFDHLSKRLYWCNKNSQSIQYYQFSTGTVHTLFQGGSSSLPTSMAVYKDFIYYFDAMNSNIYRTDKYTGSDRHLIQSDISDILSIKVYDKTVREGSNACSQKNRKRCAHLCIPLSSLKSYCLCAVGYQIDSVDPTVCVGEEGVLIYVTEHGLNGISLEREEEESNTAIENLLPPISQMGIASNLDFHAAKDLLVWADQVAGTITTIQRDGRRRNTLLTGRKKIDGLAVDWIADNIYWSNPKDKIIEMCKIEGSESYVVIHGFLNPGAVAVHPVLGFLFWVNMGVKIQIERATLDGSERTVIASSSLEYPIDLSVDYDGNLLYFIDRTLRTLERMSFDGSSRTIIFKQETMNPISLFVYQKNVYTSNVDSNGSAIYSIDKKTFNATLVRSIPSKLLKSIIVMSNTGQTGINKCVSNGGCAELCFYNGTDANCRCFHGKLTSDRKSCQEYDAFLLYSNNTSIESLHMFDMRDPNPPLKSLTFESMKSAISLTFDYANKKLFYSDIHRRSIHSVYFNGSHHEIVADGQKSVEGIAFEEVGQDLYWSCQNDASINRMSVNPMRKASKIVRLSAKDKPRGIAVDGCGRRVYWTNWNSEAPSIQSSYLNGLNITSIISTNIKMPNALVIDHRAQKIYWGDARLDFIERCNMDGSDRVILIQDFPSHPFDLAVYHDYIFWTDWGLQAVVRANKYTGKDITTLTKKIPRLMGIIAVANDTNACQSSLCRSDNGGCEDICQLDERGQVFCTCHPDRYLVKDGSSCSYNASNCSEEELPCASGFCVPYLFFCDNVSECPDESDEDEEFCANRKCKEGYFKCDDGLCISRDNVCDGKINCRDFTDESDCPCEDGFFRCTDSGICLPASSKCNMEPDCTDASDEIGCEKTNCSSIKLDQINKGFGLINCEYTTNCIHPKWICDGTNDCWDNSDEQNCIPNPSTHDCNETIKHRCRNDFCIPKEFICDGQDDCRDGNSTIASSDESDCSLMCPKGQFKCVSDKKCISGTWICDGINDCRDGSDEPDDCATRVCPSNNYKCNTTGRCIPINWVCDGDDDCPNADDEHPSQGCPDHVRLPVDKGQCGQDHFRCTLFHHEDFRCIPLEFYCDGADDCMDGSDEPKSCEKVDCTVTQFSCENNKCIPRTWVCNGKNDCKDNSDEKNCTVNGTTAIVNRECEDDRYKCDNSLCIPLDKLCNGENDCGDYSDERQCNINECESKRLKMCAHKCVDKIIGYSCECRKGYEINANNSRLCDDIDECQQEFPCSQECINTIGSYRCVCIEGYISEDEGRICRANSTDLPHLIISIRFFIREIGLNNGFNKLIVNNLTNVVALDFEWSSKCFYWSDVTHLSSSIKRICGDGTPEELHTTVQSPDGIAVDWVAKNLYWCDKGKDTIEVSKLDGKYRKVLIDDGLQDPRAIVLDPFHGYMYWTDWGSKSHIGRAGMDGSEQEILINTTVAWPNALTISYATNEIFWADAHYDYIGRCDLDGSNRKIVLNSDSAPNHLQHIFAISVFEDWLYWTDWELKSVIRANKYTGANINKVYTAIHRPMDIHVYHPYRQLEVKNNPCENEGGCNTICLLAPGGNKTCACPENYELQSDQQSCANNCSSSQFICNSTFKCIPLFWKCDTQDDCGDSSDEPEDCPRFECTPGQFQCDNRNCIHPSQICDSKDQCKDQSDEQNCNEYTCMLSQFKCPATNRTSAFCISKKHRCDDTVECPGGEDEQDCIPRTCSSDWFKCNNSQCIPWVWVCDKDKDCLDESDEQANCTFRKCQDDEFRCSNGRCIPKTWRCDGEYDCIDKEDELNCTRTQDCETFFFKCANSRCIPNRWHCDGEVDCIDGSDEIGCPVITCSSDEFKCADGSCITKENVCDGINNCKDGSDEITCPPKNCTDDEFMCVTNQTCILKEWVCDDDADCGDMSDERGCNVKCEKYKVPCDSGGCIPDYWLCDGYPDCQDGSDENATRCAEQHLCLPTLFRCSNGICLMLNKLCDGIADCPDGEDENKKTCHCPGNSTFECKNHHCVSKALVCDGVDDCTDGSDEFNCPTGCRFGQCSQICNPKKNETHSCTCAKGYTQQSWSQKNQKSCFANGNLAYMILANDNHLRMLSPYKHGNSAAMLTLTQEDATRMRIDSIDVLYGEDPRAFWTNRHDRTLVTMKIPTTESSNSRRNVREANADRIHPVLKELLDPRSVAVDWVTRTVYYIDGGDNTISAVNVDGSKKITLISTGNAQPFDLTVDPFSGELFWTERGYNPKIKVAYMNGSNQRTLIDGGMIWPTGITIDYAARRLYWTDCKLQTIETVRLDGSERNIVHIFASDEEKPNKIDVFEDLLYISTLNTNAVYRMSKFGGWQNNLVQIIQYPLLLSDVVLVQEQKQDSSIPNPCENTPCGKGFICLLSGHNSYSCSCPDGTRLKLTEGYISDSCIPDSDSENECPLNCHVGKCVQTVDGPRCQCPPLFKGPHCNIYRCSGYCKNGGRCKPDPKEETQGGVPKLNCSCTAKWKGDRCEIPSTSCSNTICHGKGKCSGNRGYFMCSCLPEYYGNRCQYSDCTRHCINGLCDVKKTTPTCRCYEGWSGPNCSTNMCLGKEKCISCDSSKCENGGKCYKYHETDKEFCMCENGFQGLSCNVSRCLNYCDHGTCQSKSSGIECVCQPGYSGVRCEILDEANCVSGSCLNGGTCDKNGNKSSCRCTPQYGGLTCDVPRSSPCFNFSCFHDGRCLVRDDEPICICSSDTTGLRCEIKVCGNISCLNGGVCDHSQNESRTSFCRCLEGYSGLNCELLQSTIAPYEDSSVKSIVVGITISIFIIIIVVIALVMWRRRGKGIGHVRLQENGGTVELINPMYLHSTDHEDESEPVFTLHDSQPTTFKNPVYDIMYDCDANLTHEEEAILLQSDPLGVLEDHSLPSTLKRT